MENDSLSQGFNNTKKDGAKILQSVDNSKCKIAGFIMFTEANAEFRKVIKDPDYRDSLNDISGEYWNIYCVNEFAKGRKVIEGGENSQSIGFLRCVWKEPQKNLEALKYFNLDSSEEMPFFVIYRVDEDNNSADQIICKIDDNLAKEEVFREMKTIVTNVTNIIKTYGAVSSDVLFSKIETRFRIVKFVKHIGNAINWFSKIKSLVC